MTTHGSYEATAATSKLPDQSVAAPGAQLAQLVQASSSSVDSSISSHPSAAPTAPSACERGNRPSELFNSDEEAPLEEPPELFEDLLVP